MKGLVIDVIALSLVVLIVVFGIVYKVYSRESSEPYLTYIVDPRKTNLAIYWKDEEGKAFGSIPNLKLWLENRGLKLKFAMNGAIFEKNQKPLGLFIEHGKTVTDLNLEEGAGNFYVKPRGVFYLSSCSFAGIKIIDKSFDISAMEFAVQSGPLMIIDGLINRELSSKSKKKFIRNGVGLMADNRVIFAVSTERVSLYEFAAFFKSYNCTTALYLDGHISQMYQPDRSWQENRGDLVTIIAETALK